ncbi:hypothetical protein PG995_015934 [Apiospora arundinis]
MAARTYVYKDFVERGIAALNANKMDEFLDPAGFSPNFVKYLMPQTMGWPPQTREEWYRDLKEGFVGQYYVEWHATIQAYWEDVENRSAIVWCTERGLFIGDQKYEMDYVMRYEFDEDGKLLKLWELTDSFLQKGLEEKWGKADATKKQAE